MTLNPRPSTLNPQPSTLNPGPQTLNPGPKTIDPAPQSLNPQSDLQVQRLGLIQQIRETKKNELNLDPDEERKQSASSWVIILNPTP
jgi:hypothetical protein